MPMYLDDQVTEKDETEDQFGVRLVIDKMSVPYLSQATIDFVDSLEASGFTIDNPAAQSSCACGVVPLGRPLRVPGHTLARMSPDEGGTRVTEQVTHAAPPHPALLIHERERAQSIQNRIADRITIFAGSMAFVYIHIVWFGSWIAFGVERYPYGLLTMIVSLERSSSRRS